MNLSINFDWTKLITPIEQFVEITPRGGRSVVTPLKLESRWIELTAFNELRAHVVPSNRVKPELGPDVLKRAFAYIPPFFETHGLYSPRQISDSTNVYLSHHGGDPVASTAEIFECSKSEIIKLDFLRETSQGYFQHNRGFVPC